MSAADHARGTILRGKYRIERVLGEGGMGIVLLATHLKLEQRVALKVLRPAARERPNVVARFAREARSAAKLRNEHVVRVLDVDETDEGDPFLVMEHLVGIDLETRIRRDGPLSAELAADYMLQVCEGVAEAHAVDIIHRDLKPANLFLTKSADGSDLVKVLDFGIAKAGEDLSVTAADAVLGSPVYMAPEQLKSSSDVGARTDIWSLGVVLYQLVSGELPFNAATVAGLAAIIASEPARPLREARPDLPPALYAVVDRCLHKAPAERFASVVELARALAEIASVPSAADRVSRVARAAAARPEPSSLDLVPVAAGRVTARMTAIDEAVEQEPAPEPEPDSAPPRVDTSARRRAGSPRRTLVPIVATLLAVAIAAFTAARFRPRAAPPVLPSAALRAATPAIAIDAAGVGFDDLVYAPSLHRVVVPAGETGNVLLVDPESRAVETIAGFTRSPSGRGGHTQGPTSAALAGDFLAVIDRSTRTIALVDPTTRQVVASHALGGVPDYVRFEPSSGDLWVTEPDAERIEIFAIDTAARKLQPPQAIDVPGGPEFIIFDATRAYTNLWKGMTSTIELRTRKLRTTFPNGCEGSRTLALDERRALLFVACLEGVVTSIDLSHGSRILGRVTYHAGIDALVYDPVRGILYAPSAAAGTMAALVVDRDGVPELSFEVTTAKGAACATVDASGAVWICDPTHGRLLFMAAPQGR